MGKLQVFIDKTTVSNFATFFRQFPALKGKIKAVALNLHLLSAHSISTLSFTMVKTFSIEQKKGYLGRRRWQFEAPEKGRSVRVTL